MMTRSHEGLAELHARATLSYAAAWRLAALLLERPRLGWYREVESLSKEILWPDLHEAATASQGATEGGYLRLLGPGGSLSPREVAYRVNEDPGLILADIAGFYKAFSFSPRAEDPIDHVSVEANFAAYLCLKVTFALREGTREDAGRASQALCLFLREHLESFAEAFAHRLQETAAESDSPHLVRAARCLHSLARKSREHYSLRNETR